MDFLVSVGFRWNLALIRSFPFFAVTFTHLLSFLLKWTLNCSGRISKLFGKCLPSRRGKGKDDTVIGAHGEDPNAGSLADGDTEEDVSPSPTEEKSTTDGIDPNMTVEDIILKPKVESEEEQADEATGPVPVSEETSNVADDGSNGEDDAEAESVVPEEEDYNWGVSCCGVELPMSKEE